MGRDEHSTIHSSCVSRRIRFEFAENPTSPVSNGLEITTEYGFLNRTNTSPFLSLSASATHTSFVFRDLSSYVESGYTLDHVLSTSAGSQTRRASEIQGDGYFGSRETCPTLPRRSPSHASSNVPFPIEGTPPRLSVALWCLPYRFRFCINHRFSAFHLPEADHSPAPPPFSALLSSC